MATRNFVPRADNEGSLGTAVKRWATAYVTTLIPNSMTPAAGTTTVAPLVFTSGTNLTAPVAGSQEYDGKVKYFTPNTSNRGVDLAAHFISLTGGYTLANSNAVQAAFNSPASGQITLPASTTYEFEAVYFITNTGTTSHTWSVLFGGTATLTSGAMLVQAVSATSSAMTAVLQGYTTTIGSAYAATAASTSATENVTIYIRGIVRINGAGTFIPQLKLSAATGVAATVLANSYFRMSPLGVDSVVSVGNWS